MIPNLAVCFSDLPFELYFNSSRKVVRYLLKRRLYSAHNYLVSCCVYYSNLNIRALDISEYNWYSKSKFLLELLSPAVLYHVL